MWRPAGTGTAKCASPELRPMKRPFSSIRSQWLPPPHPDGRTNTTRPAPGGACSGRAGSTGVMYATPHPVATSAKASATPLMVGLRRFWLSHLIADVSNCLDHRVGAGAELGAQAANVNVDGAGA